MSTSKRAPANLGRAGKALWREVTETWTLRPDECRVLEHAARELDLLERLEAELAEGSITVRGSHNQPVVNGIVTEVRQHRAAFTSLMRFLALPDNEERAEQKATDRSDQMRKLANLRWQRGA